MKLQTTITVHDVVEVDIELPYYCKTSDSFLLVVSETEALRVTCQGCNSIMTTKPTAEHTKEEIASATACTQKEFYEAYRKAFDTIWKVAVHWKSKEEDSNPEIEDVIAGNLFDEPFANELYEREEGLS
jgi:hypothetical protein